MTDERLLERHFSSSRLSSTVEHRFHQIAEVTGQKRMCHQRDRTGSREPQYPPQRGANVAMTRERSGLDAVVGLISGRWILAVLAALAAGGRRYQDLHEVMDGVSHKVLTDTLRAAERDGLISRRLDSGRMDAATLYELTDLGKSLDEPLGALRRWADANWHLVEAARRSWSARTQN